MPTNGTNNRHEYLEAWSKMMVNIWLEKIAAYRVRHSGALLDSIAENLGRSMLKDLGNNIEVIEHTFNKYGIYVDKGTGREIAKGNKGDLGFTPDRKAKPWFNRKFYYYCMKLAEKMAEISGQEFVSLMKNVIEGS